MSARPHLPQLYIGITDEDWFDFLKERQPDEVNFWQPRGSTHFRALAPGQPFLFKLHSPRNVIAGGGFFAHFSLLPLSLAWEAFGEKNGARSLAEMRHQVEKYRPPSSAQEDYPVGCIVLTDPFFFDEADWIPVPDDFSLNIVRGKGYSLLEATGADLWKEVQVRWELYAARQAAPDDEVAAKSSSPPFLPGSETGSTSPERLPLLPGLRELLGTPGHVHLLAGEMFGDPALIRPRLGQGAFRVVITDVYDRRCAVTRERVLPVLEAAHIKPVAEGGRHEIPNGLLLRSDLHRLFDRGYVTVTPDYQIRVSRRLGDDFHNGEEYFQLSKRQLWTPSNPQQQPNREFLEWHGDTIFKG